MRKKKLLLLFWIFVLILAVGAEAMLIKGASMNWYKKTKIADYGVEISYPRTYVAIEKEESNFEKISSTISATVTETQKDNGVSVDLVKDLVHVKSNASMITLLIEGLKKDKTTKTIEEAGRISRLFHVKVIVNRTEKRRNGIECHSALLCFYGNYIQGSVGRRERHKCAVFIQKPPEFVSGNGLRASSESVKIGVTGYSKGIDSHYTQKYFINSRMWMCRIIRGDFESREHEKLEGS